MREATIEEQIQWVLSYIQEGSANTWKENIIEDLKAENVEYESVGNFLVELKIEFRERDSKAVKVAELKKLEQGGRTIEEFVQEIKRATRGSSFVGRALVEEFKR